MDDFVVELPQNIVEGLVELAVQLDITNMQDLVHAILKERLNEILGLEFNEEEERVRLTQEEGAEELAQKLRNEAAGEETFSSLGPSVHQAPDQRLSDAEKASVSDTSKTLANENEVNERLDRIEEMFGQLVGMMGSDGNSRPFRER